MKARMRIWFYIIIASFTLYSLSAQGVTTGGLGGQVADSDGNPLVGANIVATHTPSNTTYGTTSRDEGYFSIPNMKVGGPYRVTVSFIGYTLQEESNVFINLGSSSNFNFSLVQEALEMAAVEVTGAQDDIMNSDRTGAATTIGEELVATMPSIKRSTRDLTRLDPRSDGNFSFGGRNWLYNNISLDGSYFNNPFGLDDPAPGGQTNSEPVSFDAVEQVQVSVAPFDVREGGFTGAGINTVTKSGTNQFKGSVYSFSRNQSLVGNKIDGNQVLPDPSLKFNQSGVSVSGPLVKDKVFFFFNVEKENRADPGTFYEAGEGDSRISDATMQKIRDRMKSEYNYDTGPWEGYDHNTNNLKLLAKIDWNINDKHNLSFRYNKLDASRDLGPHGFVLSFNNTGRGPNTQSLPFKNSGYQINNELDSYALELNSMFSNNVANRFFFSYNKFRDFRNPFSEDFPTVDIGNAGVTYTTLGHEPFSIHNILDQDVIQLTNNLTYYSGKHAITAGFNYESFKFFNSFNIFRHGVFFLPDFLDFIGGATFSSLDDFFARTASDSENKINFRGMIGSGPYKGEKIEVAQLSFYAQDEIAVNKDLKLTAGLRIDIPSYGTTPVENPFSTGLTLLDENDNSETVDQAKLPEAKPLYSPRVGYNWDVNGDRTLQVRGGVGIFTGRLPFVWVGNVISNPGANPNIPGDGSNKDHIMDDGKGRQVYEGTQSVLQKSYDLNAMVDDFKWPQVFTTNVAVDKVIDESTSATFELVHSKDLNAIYMRNADLVKPVRSLKDGRPYFGADGNGANELNPDGGAGAYVIDNINQGSSFTLTAQVRKRLNNGINLSAAYTYLDSKNNLQSTEIASVLFQSQPVQGDPNNPQLGYSQFGMRQRIIGTATYRHTWNKTVSSTFGLFFEMGEGNRYIYSGGNRYSFTYSGDVNGDGVGGNDLIYIPKDANDIQLKDASDWSSLDAFIKQDSYLSKNRGKIAERNGLLNPWFSNIDLKINNEFNIGGRRVDLSFDIMNVANLINSDWGVRKIANPAATSPLTLTGWENNEPVFDFTGPKETFVNDLSEFSRWKMQVGVRISF